jgi:transcription initiation factor TFIIIB Brf1 subunit/transcription initiation factor TFIIB
MKQTFGEITDICNKLKIGKKVIEGSKIKYKEIFIDLEISSRSNIKKAMYIYCIYFSCNYYNHKIDLDELISITDINDKHYSKVLKKLEKNNIIHSHKKIDKLIKKCKDNDLIIDKEKILERYRILKKNNIKLNNNSILLGIMFEMLDITEKRFIKIFKTTRITLEKYELLK